jgi:hypothetical protein
VPARDTCGEPAVEPEIDIWEDSARIVFSPDQQVVADVEMDPSPAVHYH